jgi:PAS domain S-box-containing protein
MLAPMPDRPSQTLELELLEFAPDAVVGVDEQGEIQLANSRTEAVFGYGRGELVGRPVEMLVPNGLRTGHVDHRDRYFAAPRTRPMGAGLDLYARRKNGSEFPCEISLSTVATDAGMMALAAIRDITDRRRDRDDLRRAVQRLQAATEVAIAVGGETDLKRVLDAIVERGRALVQGAGGLRGDPARQVHRRRSGHRGERKGADRPVGLPRPVPRPGRGTRPRGRSAPLRRGAPADA